MIEAKTTNQTQWNSGSLQEVPKFVPVRPQTIYFSIRKQGATLAPYSKYGPVKLNKHGVRQPRIPKLRLTRQSGENIISCRDIPPRKVPCCL